MLVRKLRRRTILAALGLVLSARVSLGGPPFVTDDPEPIGLGHWEFYFASQVARTADGRSGAAPFVDANFGAIRDVHLHVLVPMAFDAPSDGAHQYGYGDTEVGAKVRFVHETGRVPQVGTFPALELPTGDESRNLGAGHVQFFLPVWLQKSWGREDLPWTAYGGAAYLFQFGQGGLDWGFLGLVLQRQVRSHMLLGAEVFHLTPVAAGESDDTEFNLGTVVDLSERDHLLLSAGRSIDGPVRSRVYFAYQLTLNPAD